jgi:hypothetical protein
LVETSARTTAVRSDYLHSNPSWPLRSTPLPIPSSDLSSQFTHPTARAAPLRMNQSLAMAYMPAAPPLPPVSPTSTGAWPLQLLLQSYARLLAWQTESAATVDLLHRRFAADMSRETRAAGERHGGAPAGEARMISRRPRSRRSTIRAVFFAARFLLNSWAGLVLV